MLISRDRCPAEWVLKSFFPNTLWTKWSRLYYFLEKVSYLCSSSDSSYSKLCSTRKVVSIYWEKSALVATIVTEVWISFRKPFSNFLHISSSVSIIDPTYFDNSVNILSYSATNIEPWTNFMNSSRLFSHILDNTKIQGIANEREMF